MIELSRYVVEPLRKDESFILYRGRNKYDASQILVLSPLAEWRDRDEQAQAELKATGTIQPFEKDYLLPIDLSLARCHSRTHPNNDY